jgi:hypothetical protein
MEKNQKNKMKRKNRTNLHPSSSFLTIIKSFIYFLLGGGLGASSSIGTGGMGLAGFFIGTGAGE